MAVSDVVSYADSCRQRVFMEGFFEGRINNDGTLFHLGTTECAIVERALRAVEQGESLLIHNNFPTTSLPVAIIASYAYSQNPRIPGNEDLPMLVFPASSRGYLGEIDNFHFQTTVSAEDNETPLIPRTSIGTLSEQSSSWCIYTVKNNFIFDTENHDEPLGALFVDLRKPEWSERRFDDIEEFCESNPETATIFYTAEMNSAARLTQERLDSEPVRVTGEMLASADTTESAEGESPLTVQERILSSGQLEVLQFPVTDERLSDHISEFVKLKKKCQKKDLAYIYVARVFNRLLKQPFKPKYWSQSVGSNAFYDDVPAYIKRIERRAGNVERGSNLLNNYARKANEVQGCLNERHALQNTVLDAIQRAGDDEKHSCFVVKNTTEKKALRLAATDSGYTLPGNLDIIERKNVTPMPDTRYVFLYPPYCDDYIFEFPPSEQVAFIHQTLWSDYVQSAAREATQDITITHNTQTIGKGGAASDIEDHVFDIDTLESSIEGYLRGADFGRSDGSSTSEASKEVTSDGEELVFELSDGSSRRFSRESIVTVYDPERAKISRKTAKKIDVGEEILLIESVAGDLYDVLLDSAHERDAVREDEELVANWRQALNNVMERERLSYEDVVDEIQERGSDIETCKSVRAWAKGQHMGPLDEGDCRRVLHLARPELEGALLEQIHEQVWRGMKHLRLLHRRIGRNVRRAVEAEYNPSTTSSFGGSVNEQMIKNIARDIERQVVTGINTSSDK